MKGSFTYMKPSSIGGPHFSRPLLYMDYEKISRRMQKKKINNCPLLLLKAKDLVSSFYFVMQVASLSPTPTAPVFFLIFSSFGWLLNTFSLGWYFNHGGRGYFLLLSLANVWKPTWSGWALWQEVGQQHCFLPHFWLGRAFLCWWR